MVDDQLRGLENQHTGLKDMQTMSELTRVSRANGPPLKPMGMQLHPNH
jgi:hypothetical protein